MWIRIAYLVGMILWTLITGSAGVQYGTKLGEEQAEKTWRERWRTQSLESGRDHMCHCDKCDRTKWVSPNPMGSPMGASK